MANEDLSKAVKALRDCVPRAKSHSTGVLHEFIEKAAVAVERLNEAVAAAAEGGSAPSSSLGIPRYGVRFDGAANSGETVHRLYDAEGLVANVGTDTETAVNDFDEIYPWSARRRCCGYYKENGDFICNAYEGDPEYATDGSNGEVWVEHSLFYYSHTNDGDAEEIVISGTALPGMQPAPIFVTPDGGVMQHAYTAAYPLAFVDGKPTSRSGVGTDFMSLNDFIDTIQQSDGIDPAYEAQSVPPTDNLRTQAVKGGQVAPMASGGGSTPPPPEEEHTHYTVTTTAEWYTDLLYMLVEFATRDMQSVMMGCCNFTQPNTADKAVAAETSVNRIIVSPATAAKFIVGQTIGIGTGTWDYSVAANRTVTAIEDVEANKAIVFDGEPVNIALNNVVQSVAYKNGSCDNVLSSSGSPVSNTDGLHNCVYRGKEQPYGNAFEWFSDVLFDPNGNIWHLAEPEKYNPEIDANYRKLNYPLTNSQGAFVKSLGKDDRFPWIRLPNAVQEAQDGYYPDFYAGGAIGYVAAAVVGGFWCVGPYGGPCCLGCDDRPSDSFGNARARLSFPPLKREAEEGGGGVSVTPSDTTPIMDGVADAGTEEAYARGDHIHPRDTSKADAAAFNTLRTEVANKANRRELDELQTEVATKADNSALDALQTEVRALKGLSEFYWETVKAKVRSGEAPELFPVGYEFTMYDADANAEIVWVVRDHNHHQAADSSLTNSMTLECKYVHSNTAGGAVNVQYDAPEALYYAAEALAAGTYNFVVAGQSTDSGKTFQFTLTQPLPQGGQLCINGSCNNAFANRVLTAYASGADTTAIETATLTEGTEGTSLGMIEQGNFNNLYRVFYGNNNYGQSALRQFCNSDAAAGGVWAPNSKFDRPPTWANTLNGFKHGLPAEFLAVVQTAVVPCRTNDVFERGSIDSTEYAVSQVYNLNDKFFPLSQPEIYGTYDNSNLKDGTLLAYYNGLTNAERKKRSRNGSACYAWLRGPYPSGAYDARCVSYDSGSLSYNYACIGYGVAPACIIA